MRLTDHTDYSLRVLMYLNQNKKLATLTELAEVLSVPRNSLIKVSNQLAKLGYIETSRGRSGGLKIKERTGELSLKKIILQTEETFNLAECFKDKNCSCLFMNMCPLRNKLKDAMNSFLASLDLSTLNDVSQLNHL